MVEQAVLSSDERDEMLRYRFFFALSRTIVVGDGAFENKFQVKPVGCIF